MGEKKLHLLKIETNRMLKVFEHEQKIHDFIVYGDKYVICGDELGDIYIWDISSINEIEKSEEKQEKSNEKPEKNDEEDPKSSGSYIKFKAHEKRIKQMKILKFETLDLLITCSSDGFIKIWDVLFLVQNEQKISGSQDLGDKVQSVFKINSRERICCMEVNSLKLEKKNEENEEVEEEEEKIEKPENPGKKIKKKKTLKKEGKVEVKNPEKTIKKKKKIHKEEVLVQKKNKKHGTKKKPEVHK